jgi:hypothetical protein
VVAEQKEREYEAESSWFFVSSRARTCTDSENLRLTFAVFILAQLIHHFFSTILFYELRGVSSSQVGGIDSGIQIDKDDISSIQGR